MILSLLFFFMDGIPPLGDISSLKNILVLKEGKLFPGLNFRVKEFPTAGTDISTTPRQHNSFTNNMNDLRLYIFLNINISCEVAADLLSLRVTRVTRSIYRRQSSYTEQPLFNKVFFACLAVGWTRTGAILKDKIADF